MAKISIIKNQQTLAQTMIDRDKERDSDFIEYENMIHGVWNLPEGLPAYVGKDVNTLGHDAVYSPTRVLSSLEPDVTLFPLAGNQDTRDRANMIEQMIKWQLWGARKRRHSSIVTEIVQSSIMYHAVAVEMVDLDYQKKLYTALKIPSKRFESIRRYGRFAFNVYNPRFVHAQYSQYGVERILVSQIKTAYELYQNYGEAAKALKEDADTVDSIVEYVEYKMIDTEETCVWAEPYNGSTAKPVGEEDAIVIIEPTKHKMSYLPWSVRCGGSNLETREKYKYHPVLASVLWFGQWDNINMLDSLKTSKAMATAGAPDAVEEGANPRSDTKVDYDKPFQVAHPSPGNKIVPFPTPQIDQRLLEVSADLRSQAMKSTIPGVLQNQDVPSGMAYATYNLQLQNALSVVKPYQELAERILSDVCELMLLSIHYSKIPMRAYNWNRNDAEGYGNEYTIDPEEIYPDGIYFDVKLKADVPSDEMVKLQSVLQAVAGLGMAKEDALERFGVENPSETMNKRFEEQLLENEVNLIITGKQAEQQMAMQQQIAQQQMAMQQAQAAANPQGVEGAEGMNPANGSAPPAMVNPGATREMQTGQTRSGQQAMRGV
jgi:hypothetical protein